MTSHHAVHGRRRLPASTYAKIRKLYLAGSTQSEIAKLVGVSQPAISYIVSGRHRPGMPDRRKKTSTRTSHHAVEVPGDDSKRISREAASATELRDDS